jgi:hypothetical protein
MKDSNKRYDMMLMQSPLFAILKGKMKITLANDSVKV